MSIKKCSLIAAAAVVASLAMANSALATDGATMNAKAAPTTGITAGKANAGGLNVELVNCEPSDTSCTGSSGTSPTKTIGGVDGVAIAWTKQVLMGKSKQPACPPASITGVTLKTAQLNCVGSQIGSGRATVCLDFTGGPTYPAGGPCTAVISNTPTVAYVGAPINIDGKDRSSILFYAEVGAGSSVVPSYVAPSTGTLKSAGYKTVLNVFGSGPGASNITDFWANVNGPVKTKCDLGTTSIDYLTIWDMSAPVVDKADTKSQACTAS